MLGYFLRRKYVAEVRSILEQCFNESFDPGRSFEGVSFNKSGYVARLENWLQKEVAQLDTQRYGGVVETGDATQRARVWVGVRLAAGLYQMGASDVSKQFISRSWRPANTVANLYFGNLRTHTDAPFSRSKEELERQILGREA